MTNAVFPLIGHQLAEKRFLRARSVGRLHHGWIIQGPSGIGKSIFVRRLAGLMLGASSPDANASDTIMQSVANLSHPDLKWIMKGVNEKGQLRQDIGVDQIRALNQFFTLKPALSGWRIGVIDALDEMNLAGLNALLKTLEEPPANALLFLISHLETPLLDTIRSRCQVLPLYALSEDETKQVLEPFTEHKELAEKLSDGRPGYGLKLAEGGAASAYQAAQTLLKSIHKPTAGVVAASLQSAVSNEVAFKAFSDQLLNWTARSAVDTPALAKTWLSLHRLRAEANQMNLTPLQTATKMFSTLQQDLKQSQAMAQE